MCTGLLAVLALGAGVGFGADWNPRLAADYLDARQKAWIAWPTAIHDGAPCISCHTSLTYLLARPALSGALHENGQASYRETLLDSLRRGLVKRTLPASQSLATESVLAAFLLAADDERKGSLTAETGQALDRLWALQIGAGRNRGAWNWFSLELEPWEEPESAFYGASLAALAVGIAPAGYASRPEIRDPLDSLESFLREDRGQPLHNRLMLAWASTKLQDLITARERQTIVDSAFANQASDGGWT